MPSSFSAHHSKPSGVKIDDTSASSSTVYSSSKTDSAYLQQSKVTNTASTTPGFVYDVRFINSLSTGSTFVGLSDTPGSISAGQSLRGNAGGTALEFYTPASGVTIDDTSASSSTVYSSSKTDGTYLQQTRVKNAPSVTIGDVYDVNHINSQLASKADTSHTHQISDVTNLQTTLDGKLSTSVSNAGSSGIQLHSVSGQTLSLKTLAGSGLATVTEASGVITVNGGQDSSKVDKTSIQTLAEGDSSSETDVYSCNSVFSKAQIGTSVNTEAITLNNTSSAGILNFGSNQTTGNYANLQTYANGTRYSTQQWYATNGSANVDWYFMKANSLTRTMTIRPNDRNEVLNVLTGGIKAETLSMRDGFISCRIGNYGSSSAGRYGMVITPLINTINSEVELRGLRSTGILSDLYTNHLSGSTLTLQSRLATNRHSSTHSNIEVSTYQNGAETRVLDIGASSSSAKTVTVTGSLHATSYVTTDQTVFNNANELVTKAFVDSRLPTDVDTPVSYTIQNAVTDQNYLFGVNGAANAMALVEIPKVYTGVSASSRAVRVGFNGGDYGSGAIAVGYEALADGTGSAGQTNAVRSVAVGYQAGYQSQAANHGIYIGPYQGYQLSTSNQLRIGNSGVAPTTTGYDKAIIEGTMGTTDAGQTLRLNADTIYLGSSLPTSQPADNRLWLSNGSLSIGAVSGGGGSTFTSLTDTPASYTNGKLLYSTASGIAYTTDQIVIDSGNIEVGQVNARVNGSTNIGDNSHKFNNVFCNAIHQGNVKLVLPTVRGSVNQILKVQSVNSEVHTLHFADDNTGGGGGGGGLSFTPSFTKSTMYGKVNRTSMITVLQGLSTMFDGQIGNQSGGASNVAWYFNNNAQHAINEFTIWTQMSTAGSTSDPFRTYVCEIYGSNGTDTAVPPSGNWVRLNEGATVWLAECIANPGLIWSQYSQLYPQGFRFKCTTNMNNYNRYWLKFGFSINPCYDVHWNYNKSHEAEYT